MQVFDNEGLNANTSFIVTDAGAVVVESDSTRKVASTKVILPARTFKRRKY